MNNLNYSTFINSFLSATLVFTGFITVMFALTSLLPGKVQSGVIEVNRTSKTYKLNGMTLFLITTITLLVFTLVFKQSLAPIADYFWYLFTVANLFAIVWTSFLYINGQQAQGKNIELPNWRKFLGDLWFGVELNPNLFGVDLKMFAYQPSLIGLGLINASFAYLQYKKYGEISTQMWMFQLFWWGYLATHYYYEEFMLSTWDIIAEKFGFMLVWGDIVLVPFFYSIIGWYIIDRIEPMPIFTVVIISLLYLFGLWLFRGSNVQKHSFKKDSNTTIWGEPAKTIDGRLLISGWWGIGRKLNYTGEICVYLALSLTSGFHSVIPYFLPFWLCVLLSHRAWRDEQRCRNKYGELWEAYCQKVKFRMVPFLY